MPRDINYYFNSEFFYSLKENSFQGDMAHDKFDFSFFSIQK